MGKSTISMAIFNSKLLVYQRVTRGLKCQDLRSWVDHPFADSRSCERQHQLARWVGERSKCALAIFHINMEVPWICGLSTITMVFYPWIWFIHINNLVGGLEHEWIIVPFRWERHHPNWRTHIFQTGRHTSNQKCALAIFHHFCAL